MNSLDVSINFWQSLLKIPKTNESVTWDALQSAFVSPSGKKLYWKNNVVHGISEEWLNSGNEVSHYIDHYAKDAEAFDYYEEYNEGVTRFEQKRLHEMIVSKVPKNAENILDMGCGNAWVAGYFLKQNKKVVSADIGITNIDKALQKYPSQNHYGLLADAFDLPLAESSFDVIIAAEIMEHVPSPSAFMESLYRVLKPGGTIIITTPYHEKIEYSLCIHCNQPTPRHAHLHSFHEKNIPPLLPAGCTQELDIFMNKYLIKSRSHVILKYLPLRMWRFLDGIAEKILPGALRLMITIQKP